MTTAKTEPADGFLDHEFASFREARLRAKKARAEDALEHRHAKVAEPDTPSSAPTPAAETAAPPPPPEDAFFGTSTHERTSIRARTRDVRTTAMLEVMLDDLDGDVAATRTGERIESPASVAPVAPVTPVVAPVAPVSDGDSTRGMSRAAAGVEDSCSDPEFERFRAARKSSRPDSGRLKKPDARPDSGRLRKPDLEGHCSDPEFERFRAARQAGEAPAPRRVDSGRLRKPDPTPPTPSAIEAMLAVGLPEPAAATEPVADAPPSTETPDEPPTSVFFGTTVHERAVVRARVVGDPPEADAPTPRRAPPPPLPQRPPA